METTKRGGIPLYVWMLVGFLAGLGGGLYVNLNGLEVVPWVMEIIQAVGQIDYGRLLGDAADSPLVDREGSANQVSGVLGVSYSW